MNESTTDTSALVRFILLPSIFLTVALLGGLRVGAEANNFIFIAPPLITLVLSVLLMILVARSGLVNLRGWLSNDYPPLTNTAHALTLLAFFFASAQAFNSVLPERGLLHWMFSFFFLWTIWNNLFSSFDARRLLRSLAVLFSTAFVIKHILLASLYTPGGGWLQRLSGALLEGVSLGTLDVQTFAAATGYISFFTLALYIVGLILLPSTPEGKEANAEQTLRLIRDYRDLPSQSRAFVREQLSTEANAIRETRQHVAGELISAEEIHLTAEQESNEVTIVREKRQ